MTIVTLESARERLAFLERLKVDAKGKVLDFIEERLESARFNVKFLEEMDASFKKDGYLDTEDLLWSSHLEEA